MSPDAAATSELAGLRHHGERLADRLPSLMVEADRVASTVAQGVHGRRRTGVGDDPSGAALEARVHRRGLGRGARRAETVAGQ